MISSVRQAIVDKLLELYPEYTIYEEDIPLNKPSFLIVLIGQDYSKRMNVKFKSLLSFDVAYFSDKGTTEIRADCLAVQLALFRGFDLINSYRVLNKKVTITDNVLHFTFDINYSEMIEQNYVKMQQPQITTRTEE
ncbi:MAG: hypothetical protein CVV02_15220 [Firmicutes bacterium HGW-Firmicutes-7]|nr:MAG: hypothetical protein CVV02_15220 [Firmicutes bacterium HGW-Firmicutes-7]